MHRYSGIGVVISFFAIVVGIAFINNPHFPVQVIAGESSVGTWMSGVLLTMCAAASLIVGMRRDNWRWYLITVFFLVLAADEHFMFHEKVKEHLIFADPAQSRWLYELPVLTAAIVGGIISYLLWQKLHGLSRYLLLAAVTFGAFSVTIDVLTAGVLWEDGFKLLAELSMTCAMLMKHVEG